MKPVTCPLCERASVGHLEQLKGEWWYCPVTTRCFQWRGEKVIRLAITQHEPPLFRQRAKNPPVRQ